MSDPRQQAKDLLVHYFGLVYTRACGDYLDCDSQQEIESIVDLIFDEIPDVSSEVEAHETRHHREAV